MFETICDIKGLHCSNPLYYTPQYLENSYVKANHLAKHIHLFNQQISRIDYTLFSNLKGSISTIEETEEEKIYDGAIRSTPFESKNSVYFFNKELELYKIHTQKDAAQEEVLFSDSLKMPKILSVVKSFGHIKATQTDIVYNRFLEPEKIDEHNFHTNKKTCWEKQNQQPTKYIFKETDGLIFKIHIRNNREEQSKTTVIYTTDSQLSESKTYSQKNKTKLLYEAAFNYENGRLKEIIYTRYPFSIAENQVQKYLFLYNDKGLLTQFKDPLTTTNWSYDQNGNPVSVKKTGDSGHGLSEINMRYTYDMQNNWIRKEIETFIDKVKKSEKKLTRKLSYF